MVKMPLAEDAEAIDADGLRFTGNTGAVKYIWNGQTLVAETNNINTVSTWYTQAPTSEFGELIGRFSGVSGYPLMDAPGTVDRPDHANPAPEAVHRFPQMKPPVESA